MAESLDLDARRTQNNSAAQLMLSINLFDYSANLGGIGLVGALDEVMNGPDGHPPKETVGKVSDPQPDRRGQPGEIVTLVIPDLDLNHEVMLGQMEYGKRVVVREPKAAVLILPKNDRSGGDHFCP